MSRIFFNPFTGQFFSLIARRRVRLVRRRAAVVPEVEELRARAKAELPALLAALAARHGFEYRKVFIKNNVSNWGSCSSLGNINLNLRLVTLPPDLADYVMLHELCHLRHMNHGPKFHALLESVCPGHLALARRLKAIPIK